MLKTLLVLAAIVFLIAMAVAAIISALARALRFGSGVVIGVALALIALVVMGPDARERTVHTVAHVMSESIRWVRDHLPGEPSHDNATPPPHAALEGDPSWHA